jgi:hypothetical protein
MSEPAVIAGIAKATLGTKHAIDWDGMICDYNRIRDKIEIVFPDFKDFNVRVRKPGGFRLDVPATYREWHNRKRKGQFPRRSRPGGRRTVAGYYPEMNRVIALSDHDRKSGTPVYKGIPGTVRRSTQDSEATMP